MSQFSRAGTPTVKKWCSTFNTVALVSVIGLSGLGCDSNDGPPAKREIQVQLANLAAGASVQLANNGADLSTVSRNGTFTFPTGLAPNAPYAVTVATQPAGQHCNVGQGSGTVASANVTSVTVTCAQKLDGGTGTLSQAGATLTLPAAQITAPSGATLQNQAVTVASIAPPAGLPQAMTPIGAAIDIGIDKPEALNAPLLVNLRYDAGAVKNKDDLAVMHFNTTTRKYEPVTILAHDKTANSFKVEARTFSPFLVVEYSGAALPASYAVPNFSPNTSGWNIPNFGGYFTPGGNGLGMAAYSAWYFGDQTGQLNGKFPSTGAPSIAQLLATRAMLAQSQYWALKSNTYLSELGKPATARMMKAYLALTGQPLILLMGRDGQAQHAGVVYGFDAAGFTFYDTNTPNVKQTVNFDGSNWGTYAGFNSFTFVALPSLGRTEDFRQLTTEAAAGFTRSSEIALTSPTPGQLVTEHSVQLTGTLSGGLASGASLIAYVKGVPQLISSSEGAFSATLPVSSGTNTFVLFAGVDIAQQSNWYKNAATLVLDIEGKSAPSSLLTTLTWNQGGIDVDLYVGEPGLETAWYANKSTTSRLTLDFDNVTGFGPEHTTLTTTGPSAGAAIAGLYPIWVHYYTDYDSGQTATGTVTIVINEGQPNQKIASKTFSIAKSNPDNDQPGSTGPDWVQIGTVDLVTGTINIH